MQVISSFKIIFFPHIEFHPGVFRLMAGISLMLTFAVTQTIRINEFMSSNSETIQDEDGDYSDWIELYNSGNEPVNLAGFSISDDPDEPGKWTFPEILIDPEDHFLIFASGKNRTQVSNHWETIIDWGDDWKYFPGYTAPPPAWTEVDFDDSQWAHGPTGIGYGDGDDATILQPMISFFCRKSFQVDTISEINMMIMHMDYDDAFVAYLNGVEIARSNIGTPGVIPPYNAGADTWREALIYSGGYPEEYSGDWAESLLTEGENVLAVEIHNYSLNSSDMSFIPFLTLGMTVIPPNPQGTPDILNLSISPLHTNFSISSSGETLVLSNPEGVVIDTAAGISLPADLSFGRETDGAEDWVVFTQPSPGDENSGETFAGITANPEFSQTPGFYNTSIWLTLSCETENAQIFFTTDGSEPNENSQLYSDPLEIGSTMVIRSRSFKTGFLPGNTITGTYFIGVSSSLPVVSLSTSPENFFNPDSGIYVMGQNASPDFPYFGANFWQDWERPVHFEIFEDGGESSFSSDAGVKIHGAYTRGLPQKSLAVFARTIYGAGEFDYSFFPDENLAPYESFVLRNSGNDWESTMLRDGMMTSLVEDEGLDLQSYRPVLVYLNGEYWGIHNLREKISEHFISQHHDVDPDDLDILEGNAIPIQGSADDYNFMVSFLQENDISNMDNYNYITSLMDMDEFITYEITEIYFDNQDWPGNNIKFWRSHVNNSKWRWILFDTDFGFGIWNPMAYTNNTLAFALNPNGPGWPNPPWSTFLLRTLLQNQVFKEQFINRYCDLLNTTFKPNPVVDHIQDIKSIIEPEMPAHYYRWGGNISQWNERIDVLELFALNRPAYARSHLQAQFDPGDPGLVILGIAAPGTGKIKINSYTPVSYPWQGIYYHEIDIHLTGIPSPGYEFSHWSSNYGTDPEIYVTPQQITSVTAYFEPIEGYEEDIVINEINYHSHPDFNTGDWVEFYNDNTNTVDISGWEFSDSGDGHQFIFPENSLINSGEYFVICHDPDAFFQFYSDTGQVLGTMDFGLSGSGESIQLRDQFGELVDSLTYDDSFPWPVEADGDGSSLELIHPDMDNSIPDNWMASISHGTPGSINSVFVPNCSHNGDANGDEIISVLDIVAIVGHILGEYTLDMENICNGDIVNDGEIDVLDIVMLVDIILT